VQKDLQLLRAGLSIGATSAMDAVLRSSAALTTEMGATGRIRANALVLRPVLRPSALHCATVMYGVVGEIRLTWR